MNKLRYEAVIFDLDGVIVDTAKFHFLAWKKLAKELGIEFTKKDNEKLKGVSRMRSLDIILSLGDKTLSLDEKEKLAFKKNNWYLKYVEEMTPKDILPNIKSQIELLKNNNIKIAIGSASKNAKKILKKIKLLDDFDSIVDGTVVKKAKPDPEVFIKAADELDVSYEKCIVIEDSIAGIKAANSVDMFTIGIGDKKNLNEASIILKDLTSFDFKEILFC